MAMCFRRESEITLTAKGIAMSLNDSKDAYGAVSIATHWLLAAVVIALLGTGLVAGELLDDAAKGAVLAPHKAAGVAVLAVVAAMGLWRLTQRERPGAVPGTAPMEALGRKAMHAFLVLATVAMSVSGVAMAIFKGKDVNVFDLFVVPAQAETPWLAGMAHEVHVIGGWILLIAVVGHAAVAVKHHVVDHDATFARMVGGRVLHKGA
jgi:cytochrome b561